MKSKKSKNMKYLFVALFLFTISIGQIHASNYQNYYGIVMTNEEYNNLVNLGFTSDEIYYMSEETYLANKDIESELVVKNGKYYKTTYTDLNGKPYMTEISQEEYENQGSITTRGYVETEYKYVQITMTNNTDTFRYKVSMSWKNMPSTRSYDIIGIGYNDSDIYISSSVYFYYHYCVATDDCTNTTLYYDKQKTSTGGSAVYKIPSDARSLSAVLYYDVAKSNTDTITRLDACADYAHATSNVTSTQYRDYYMQIAGIVYGSNAAPYYDAIPCALASYIGNW